MKHRTGTHACEWLTCAAVSTKDIVSSDSPTAKSAINGLARNSLIAKLGSWHSIINPTRHQLLEMNCQFISQLTGGPKTIFRLVLNRSHQDLLHLRRDARSDLAGPRIL